MTKQVLFDFVGVIAEESSTSPSKVPNAPSDRLDKEALS